jgi:hypothetical protein
MPPIVQDVLQISKSIFDIDADVGQRRENMAVSRAEFDASMGKAQAEIDALLQTRAKHVTLLEALLVSPTTNLTQPERVLRFLKQHEEYSYTANELSDELDINVNSVRAVLSLLLANDEIDSPERGVYTYNTPTPAASVPTSGFKVVDFGVPIEQVVNEDDEDDEIPTEDAESSEEEGDDTEEEGGNVNDGVLP